MTYKLYKQRKEEFDNQVFLYIMKRLFEDRDESDACHEGIIDGIGNVLENTTDKNAWAYTKFDEFINMMKINIGEDKLRQLFSNYQDMVDVDALHIMNSPKMNLNDEKVKLIVTKVYDKSYLPDYLYHDEAYTEQEVGLNFTDQLSRALTIATFLLYCLRKARFPDEAMFNEDISESVESTFNVRLFNDYQKVCEFCMTHNLVDHRKITNEGIRMVVEIAKAVADSGLLNSNKSVHNQGSNWIKLSKV